MKSVSLILCALCVVLSASAIASSAKMTSAMSPTIVMPGGVKWSPVPGVANCWVATIYGTPDKAGSGEYAQRYKLADGLKFPVHYHLQTEQVTVLSGTLLVGLGDKFDASKLSPLAAGSFVAIPAHLNHFAQAKGETILEVHGMAPASMVMVK